MWESLLLSTNTQITSGSSHSPVSTQNTPEGQTLSGFQRAFFLSFHQSIAFPVFSALTHLEYRAKLYGFALTSWRLLKSIRLLEQAGKFLTKLSDLFSLYHIQTKSILLVRLPPGTRRNLLAEERLAAMRTNANTVERKLRQFGQAIDISACIVRQILQSTNPLR